MIPSIPGTALNKVARRTVLERANQRLEIGATNQEVQSFISMMEQIGENVDHTYDMGDYKKDLLDPVVDYIDNKISLEEALKRAEHNAWIRLNE